MNRTGLLIVLIGGLLFGGTQPLLLGQAPDLENEITAGNEVSFPIKYNSAVPGYVYMADGTVTLSKTTFVFKATYGRRDESFSVSPDKILELENQPEQSSRIHLRVAIKNKKGNKEIKQDYYWYNAGAQAMGGDGYGQGASISCDGCDDSMDGLYGLLTKFRDQNWSATSAPSASAAIAPAPPPPPPPVAPLKLPSTYVSAQTPADKLQLNADNLFSLREGGQLYHGTFVLSGDAIELNISDTGTKTTLNRQGDNLTDSSGQTWNFREQSAETAPSGPMLQNKDIIKMVKTGVGDATIIAKINRSQCQFDTSTYALVQLKKSGVRPAVLKAMVGAGK
jgi:hypothetical protein